jgi:hypothetical protein
MATLRFSVFGSNFPPARPTQRTAPMETPLAGVQPGARLLGTTITDGDPRRQLEESISVLHRKATGETRRSIRASPKSSTCASTPWRRWIQSRMSGAMSAASSSPPICGRRRRPGRSCKLICRASPNIRATAGRHAQHEEGCQRGHEEDREAGRELATVPGGGGRLDFLSAAFANNVAAHQTPRRRQAEGRTGLGGRSLAGDARATPPRRNISHWTPGTCGGIWLAPGRGQSWHAPRRAL